MVDCFQDEKQKLIDSLLEEEDGIFDNDKKKKTRVGKVMLPFPSREY